jgi:hypothetical protein
MKAMAQKFEVKMSVVNKPKVRFWVCMQHEALTWIHLDLIPE